MRRPSHTPDAVRAVTAPAKAVKRRPINPIYPAQKEKAPEQYLRRFFIWCRGTASNAPVAQQGDFQANFLKIQM